MDFATVAVAELGVWPVRKVGGEMQKGPVNSVRNWFRTGQILSLICHSLALMSMSDKYYQKSKVFKNYNGVLHVDDSLPIFHSVNETILYQP